MKDDGAPGGPAPDQVRRDEEDAIEARGRRRLLQGGAGAGAFVTVLANRPTFALAQNGSTGSCTHSGACAESDE